MPSTLRVASIGGVTFYPWSGWLMVAGFNETWICRITVKKGSVIGVKCNYGQRI